jgi:mono/diheme cytochrome c family protein
MAVLPVSAQQLVQGKSPTIAFALQYGAVAVVALLAITLVAGIIRPGLNNRVIALTAMVCAFITLGSFEWTREAARRPYVINEVMYSNSIRKDAVERLNGEGYLRSALWVTNHEIDAGNRVAAGRELYIQQCYSCHTLGGDNNDLVQLTANMSYQALVGYIGRIHEIRPFMPPFAGTEVEARALAAYLAGELHGKDIADAASATGDSLAAGSSLFEQNCSACHAAEEVAGHFAGQDIGSVGETLLKLDEISDEMQPFSGTEQERSLLSGYLLSPEGESSAAAGADGPMVFNAHCSSCHGVDDLLEKTREWDKNLIFANLGRLPELVEGMPPFTGSEKERESLAGYLDSLKGGE